MDTDKRWFALEITADLQVSEAIEFALNELDALGTEIDNLGKKQRENVCIIGYFNEKPDDELLRKQLNEALRIYDFPADSIKKTEWREVENQDWLAEWKKHWRPTETEKFIVAPTWSEIENTEKTIIRIEPSMAFGTGTHETTRLCLRAIEQNLHSNESFFDVGTGTGILAIAAAKLKNSGDNQRKILACDTDFDSITIAGENAEINDVSDRIEFFVGSISEETQKFDFVCANLTADVIVPLLPLLIEKTKRILILSGILKEQEDSIVEELKKFQIQSPQIEIDGEWISILIENGK